MTKSAKGMHIIASCVLSNGVTQGCQWQETKVSALFGGGR